MTTPGLGYPFVACRCGRWYNVMFDRQYGLVYTFEGFW